MTIRYRIQLALALGLVALLLSGCGSPAPQPPPAAAPLTELTNAEVGPTDPQVYLLEPDPNEESLSVTSPFNLRVGVANLKVPIQEMVVHIALNAACTPAGEVINPDAQHVALSPGKMQEPRFNLPVGKHRICLQLSNRNNVVLDGLGLTRVYDLEVVP